MKILITACLLALPGAVWAHSIQPGVWRAQNSVKLNGISLPGSENEECIPKSKARDLRATLAKDLREKGCELTQWSVKNQKLKAELRCQGDIEATGYLEGAVTTKMYDLNGEARGKWKAFPATVAVHMTGNWVGACQL